MSQAETTFSSGSKYPIPYEIDYNKTYYLSFNYGNMTAGNFISIVDNRNKVLYQSVNSPGSGSVITEIKEAFYPKTLLIKFKYVKFDIYI